MFKSIRPRRNRRPRLEQLESRHLLAADLELTVNLNGDTASTAPGPILAPGQSVEWTYQLTNTGDVPLTGVSIADDGGSGNPWTPEAVLAPEVPLGMLQATYALTSYRMLHHPTLPYVYATLSTTNRVAIINSETLQLERTIQMAPYPLGMAVSNDGSRLYVANAAGSTIGVIDTATFAVLPSITVPEAPTDIEVGADGRLYVLTNNRILQVNPDGISAGPSINGAGAPGELENQP